MTRFAIVCTAPSVIYCIIENIVKSLANAGLFLLEMILCPQSLHTLVPIRTVRNLRITATARSIPSLPTNSTNATAESTAQASVTAERGNVSVTTMRRLTHCVRCVCSKDVTRQPSRYITNCHSRMAELTIQRT